jgi:hypothetical protein
MTANAGAGYICAVGVTSFVLVEVSLLLNLILPGAFTFGLTTAHGLMLVAASLALSLMLAFYMAFIALIPFIAIHWYATVNNIRSGLYYIVAGSITAAFLGVVTPMGSYALLAGPFAGAAGGWTFWRLSVRDL